MVAVDPAERPTFDSLLHTSRGSLFPECFYSTFHDFISSVNDISASMPFFGTSNTLGIGVPSGSSPQNRNGTLDEKLSITDDPQDGAAALPNDSDRRIMRIWAEFDVIEPCFLVSDDMESTTVKVDYATQYSTFKPIQVR